MSKEKQHSNFYELIWGRKASSMTDNNLVLVGFGRTASRAQASIIDVFVMSLSRSYGEVWRLGY